MKKPRFTREELNHLEAGHEVKKKKIHLPNPRKVYQRLMALGTAKS